MAATTGFKTLQPPSRVIVHPITAPTVDNVAPVGTLWMRTAPAELYAATAEGAGGTTTTWTKLRP